MKTIMIDMDNTITNPNFPRIIEEFMGKKLDFDSYNAYEFQDIIGDRKDEFFRAFKNINLYKYAEMKLLFTAWHNKDMSDEELSQQGIIRVDSWDDIKRILLDGYSS